MRRFPAVLVLILMCFGGAQWCSAQSPRTSSARDRRLEDALTDISLLKRLVREQGRRIADLEKSLKVLQAAAAPVSERPVVEERLRVPARPLTSSRQNPAAWGQIKEGLSRAQVEDLLGKPTSVDAIIDSQTLYYKSDPSSGNSLMGSVKLVDDRVVQVSPPPF